MTISIYKHTYTYFLQLEDTQRPAKCQVRNEALIEFIHNFFMNMRLILTVEGSLRFGGSEVFLMASPVH